LWQITLFFKYLQEEKKIVASENVNCPSSRRNKKCNFILKIRFQQERKLLVSTRKKIIITLFNKER
jgi:hypothetical protein